MREGGGWSLGGSASLKDMYSRATALLCEAAYRHMGLSLLWWSEPRHLACGQDSVPSAVCKGTPPQLEQQLVNLTKACGKVCVCVICLDSGEEKGWGMNGTRVPCVTTGISRGLPGCELSRDPASPLGPHFGVNPVRHIQMLFFIHDSFGRCVVH